LFDPSRVPPPVRDRLAVIGFWVCPPDLRDKLGHWDDLDETGAAVAVNDLRLLGSATGRETATSIRRGLELTAPAG
jgi:hypothetical protein